MFSLPLCDWRPLRVIPAHATHAAHAAHAAQRSFPSGPLSALGSKSGRPISLRSGSPTHP
eukprot:7266040-Pyramimonas_sp.AAC.1